MRLYFLVDCVRSLKPRSNSRVIRLCKEAQLILAKIHIGFTVLVPRKHLTSDIFSLDKGAYTQLMDAAHVVAQVLKRAFGIHQIGMIFEGFEIDYAHVKLIPIRNPVSTLQLPSKGRWIHQEEYHKTYPGYVTSLQGPLEKDTVSLCAMAQSTRKMLQHETVKAPKSWLSPTKHTLAVLQEPWYGNLVAIQDILFHTSIAFFNKTMGYKYALVPATTNAISSPMGLGSDSLPVSVSLLGKDTHLADSMQFALEYFLRVQNGGPGVYYINTSFRGEEADRMHLNQFYHVECELLGTSCYSICVKHRVRQCNMRHCQLSWLHHHTDPVPWQVALLRVQSQC